MVFLILMFSSDHSNLLVFTIFRYCRFGKVSSRAAHNNLNCFLPCQLYPFKPIKNPTKKYMPKASVKTQRQSH